MCPDLLSLDKVVTFHCVARRGSFTAAAGDLRLTPSAVSKHVASLEERLGVQLIHRTTRRLTLTQVGAGYFEACDEALRRLRLAEDTAVRSAGQMKGPLRVHATPGIGQRLLLPVILNFKSLYPDISVALTMGQLPADLLTSEIDVLVTVAHRGEIRGAGIGASELAAIEYFVCASPSYLAARGRPATPQELVQHDCLIQETQKDPRIWRFSAPGAHVVVNVEGSFSTNYAAALEEAVLAGLGLGRIASFVVDRHVREGRLDVVFDNLQAWGQVVTAYFPNGRQSARLQVFLDYLKTEVPKMQYKEGSSAASKRPGRAASSTR